MRDTKKDKNSNTKTYTHTHSEARRHRAPTSVSIPGPKSGLFALSYEGEGDAPELDPPVPARGVAKSSGQMQSSGQ